MNLLNWQDFLDVYYRVRRTGIRGIVNRLAVSRRARIEAAWDNMQTAPKYWADIECIRESLNRRVSGDPAVEPIRWFVDTYLKSRPGIRVLSLGSGAGQVEFLLDEMCNPASLDGIDISRKLTARANARARKEGKKGLHFICGDLLKTELPHSTYDVVFAFHSLHHFANVGEVLARANAALKQGGMLAFEEYVGPNRFQWRSEQLDAINDLLRKIPSRYRKRYGLSVEKVRVKAPGVLRMLLADPSEAVDSESILPAVEKHFEIIEMKNMGGTIAHALFHDIAQNFAPADAEALSFVKMVLDEETRMIDEGSLRSDFAFVVARKKADARHS